MGGPRQRNDRVRTVYVELYVIKFETDSTIIQTGGERGLKAIPIVTDL